MIRITHFILATGIIMVWARVAVSAQTGTTSPNPCIHELLKEDFSLVETEVVSVGKPAKRQVPATLEVGRVFVGEVKPGMRFKAPFMRQFPKAGSFFGLGPGFFYPPPEVGEKQIWVVRQKKDGTLECSRTFPFFLCYWPVRSSKRGHIGPTGPKYANCVKLAEMIHELSKSRVEEQISILKRGAKSPIPLVSEGAVSCLKKWKSPACKKVLAELRTGISRLPVPNQTYLDDALCEVFRKAWIDAPDRRKLLQSWTSAQVMNHYQRDVFYRLQSASQTGQLGSSTLLDLTTKIEKNQNIELKIRRTTLFIVANATEKWRKQDKDGFFRLLTDLIQNATAAPVREGAACVLRNCSWLHTPQNISIIRRIKGRISEKEPASLLDEIVKAHTKDKLTNPAGKAPNPKAK